MKLKSYFSGTVEAAMELARQEMGEEALLIHARPATPETRYLGAYEVVFGAPVADSAPAPAAPASAIAPRRAEFPVLTSAAVAPGAPPAAVQPAVPAAARIATAPAASSSRAVAEPSAAGSAPANATTAVPTTGPATTKVPALAAAPAGAMVAPAAPGVDRLVHDVAELRRQIERLSVSFGAPVAASAEAQEQRRGEQTFLTDSTLGRPGATRAVVALVGPPGVGKTTTLVKLAARYGLACRKPAQILTADVYRIAAADQLRALAAILGIGCDVAETPVALAQALEEYRSKEMVLIDTPGLAMREMEDGAELAQLLASHPETDTHLVLAASMNPADLARYAERYAVFQPRKLIFTRIDETTQYGVLTDMAARLGLPVSFLATGQQIPDHLEEATPARLRELALGVDTAPPAASLGAAA